MSDQQRGIYRSEADRYEALISREDYQGNIPQVIDEIIKLDGLDILDLGAGTGRLTLMLAPRARSIAAFDLSPGMLRVCRKKLIASRLSNWQVAAADHRRLPIRDHSVDLAVSGWSVSYLSVWDPENGQAELDQWLAEIQRVLRKAGTILMLESLGTGNESPVRLEHLQTTYRWLDDNGFRNQWIRTDYRFQSIDEAEELSRFFFGDELSGKVKQNNWVILPECTGVWWKRI